MAESDSASGPSDPLAIRRKATPERVGLIDAVTGEEWTYAELDDAAEGVAAWLRDAVDDRAPTVGLFVDARPAVHPLAFGGFRAGARVGLLDVNLDDETLGERVERLEPDLIVCEAESESGATAVDGPGVVSLDHPTGSGVERVDPFDADRREPRRVTDRSTDAGELVVFTSGTTGDPKPVRLPLETLVASAVASALRLGVAAKDRWLVPIPTYHVGGFSPFVRCTQAGTTAVLQREFDVNETVATIDSLDVTCASLVPTQLTRLLDAGWEPPERFRFALVGGGPVPASLVDRCRERGVPICPTYGTTETASQVATARPETAFARPGTVGRPLALARVTVVDDDDGTTCPAGESGEIVVDGPTVTPGYLDGPRSDAPFDERGFHTGDIGYADEEGYLWIEGRLDDRIVTGGENVPARTVASAIESLDGVEDVAVVGLDDPEWGERVAALVVVDDELAVEDVLDHSREQLPTYAVPKTITFTEELPTTPSGTVNRTAVERELR